MDTREIFKSIIECQVGTTRRCNDHGIMQDEEFKITAASVDGMAKNFEQWWNDEYDYSTPTVEFAEEFFEEIYPKI